MATTSPMMMDVVIRVHKVPGRKMYVPSMDGLDLPPIPISSTDTTPCTNTNLDNVDEATIDDIWVQ